MVELIITILVAVAIVAIVVYAAFELTQISVDEPLYITMALRWLRGYIRDRRYVDGVRWLTQWLHRRLQW